MLRELRSGDQSPGLRSPAQQSLGAALDQAAGGSPVRRVSFAWSAAQLAVRSHAEHATAPPQTHPWAGNTPFERKAAGGSGADSVSSIAGSDAGGANSEPPTPSRWTIGGGSYVAAVSPARLPPPLPGGLSRVPSPMRAAVAAAPTSPARSTSSNLSGTDLQRCSATASALCKLQEAQVCPRRMSKCAALHIWGPMSNLQ